MDIHELVRSYGYIAVAVGSFFEGETFVALAGFFAHLGTLKLPLVIAFGAFGAFCGHVFWFSMGRWQGGRIVSRFPSVERQFHRFLSMLEEHGWKSVFVLQFLYGFRITTAIIFGVSRIPTHRFILLLIPACLTWATVVSLLGYYFGLAVEEFLGREGWKIGVGIILVVTISIFLWHRWSERSAPIEHDHDLR